jgi:hypothetical protein
MILNFNYMNKWKLIYKITIFVFMCNVVLNLKLLGQLPPDDPAFELVFNDDFNGSQVDYTKWVRIPGWNQGYNTGDLCGTTTAIAYCKWKTKVKDEMDTTNCKVSNGSVKLFTRKEDYLGEVWTWPNGVWTIDTIPFKYTTSLLISLNKFRYGYFEIRFKLPQPPVPPKKHLGFGPNFWLYSADPDGKEGWKNYSSEIDIFEINSFDASNNQSNLYTNNVHYQNCPYDNSCHIQNVQYCGYISNNSWHTAAANWTPSKIELYLDGNKLRDFPCKQLNLPPDSLIAMPIFININSPAGNFCSNFDTINANGTSFPYIYEIDYVKVWQLKKACDTAKVYCNFIPSNYNSKLYQSVTIGGSGCNAPISNQNSLSIYATDYILLNEGFSVDNKSNVFLNIEDCRNNNNGIKKSAQTFIPQPPPASFLERQKRHY